MVLKQDSIAQEEVGRELSIVKTQTINNTSTTVSRAKRRAAIVITNVSTGGQNISLSLSNELPAVDKTGLYLKPGEHYSDSNNANYICWTGLISAIADAAGGAIAVYERSVD